MKLRDRSEKQKYFMHTRDVYLKKKSDSDLKNGLHTSIPDYLSPQYHFKIQVLLILDFRGYSIPSGEAFSRWLNWLFFSQIVLKLQGT